jgi:hypothetical protein
MRVKILIGEYDEERGYLRDLGVDGKTKWGLNITEKMLLSLVLVICLVLDLFSFLARYDVKETSASISNEDLLTILTGSSQIMSVTHSKYIL